MNDFPTGMDKFDCLMSLRIQMLKFARNQLGDISQAEDVVQEALEGAIKNASALRGKAAWKSWVFAILRHKIADVLRQRYRAGESTVYNTGDEQNYEILFDESGSWAVDGRTIRWHRPDHAIEQESFWKIFEICLSNLPEQHARAFMMREFIGLETPEICREMEVSTNNLNTMLWRARMRLRECLSQRWFQNEG